MAVPPYSSSTVMPSRPRPPSFFHRSAGKKIGRAIFSAPGGQPGAAKSRTERRSISTSSLKAKRRVGKSIMGTPAELVAELIVGACLVEEGRYQEVAVLVGRGHDRRA